MTFFYALVDRKAIHEKAVLLRSQLLQLVRVPRPFKMSVAQKLIQEQEAVAFPQQGFDPVRPAAAEEKESSLIIRVQVKLCLYQHSQAGDAISEIRSAAGDIDFLESTGVRIIEHG